MQFGTVEYDLKNQNEPKKRAKFNKNKSNRNKNNTNNKTVKKETEKVQSNKEQPMAIYPQLPDNWIKPTLTGNESLDETAFEIEQKLKRTLVRFE